MSCHVIADLYSPLQGAADRSLAFNLHVLILPLQDDRSLHLLLPQAGLTEPQCHNMPLQA
jgi:hypothetical protein